MQILQLVTKVANNTSVGQAVKKEQQACLLTYIIDYRGHPLTMYLIINSIAFTERGLDSVV